MENVYGSTDVNELPLKFKSIKLIKSLKTKESMVLIKLKNIFSRVIWVRPENERVSIVKINRLDKSIVVNVKYEGNQLLN